LQNFKLKVSEIESLGASEFIDALDAPVHEFVAGGARGHPCRCIRQQHASR